LYFCTDFNQHITMKNFALIIFSILLSFSAFAQDIIIKKSGEEIKAKILEVAINEIKYKRYDFQDGPLYTLSKDDVLLIRYENGVNEVITRDPASTTAPTPTPAPVVTQPTTTPTPATTPTVIERIDYTMGNYSQNGRYMSKSRVISTLKATKDAEILGLIRKSNSSKVTGNILAAALGIPLMIAGTITTLAGVVMVEQDVNPDAKGVAAVGGVLAGTGIMLQFTNIAFQTKSRKAIENAIAIYNDKYTTKSTTTP